MFWFPTSAALILKRKLFINSLSKKSSESISQANETPEKTPDLLPSAKREDSSALTDPLKIYLLS